MIELFGAFILGFFTAQVIDLIFIQYVVPKHARKGDYVEIKGNVIKGQTAAYDPFEDEDRKLRGEVESYFD